MKHCILAKYKETVTAEQKAGLLSEIEAIFAPLTDTEGIHGVEVIPNVINRPNRYDVLIRIDMDQEALDQYDHCQSHKIWKSDFMPAYVDKKAIFDYE